MRWSAVLGVWWQGICVLVIVRVSHVADPRVVGDVWQLSHQPAVLSELKDLEASGGSGPALGFWLRVPGAPRGWRRRCGPRARRSPAQARGSRWTMANEPRSRLTCAVWNCAGPSPLPPQAVGPHWKAPVPSSDACAGRCVERGTEL